MSNFAEVILCRDKKTLKKMCGALTVTKTDFVNFILLCKAGATHLNHTMHWFDYVPEHLMETEEDRAILSADRETQRSPKGQKSLRKLFKTHGERKYKVGHMFVSKELAHPISEWHFVFFEMQELESKENHWCGGSHVHITNYLWPNLYCQDIWGDFISKKEFPNSKIHLAFADDE